VAELKRLDLPVGGTLICRAALAGDDGSNRAMRLFRLLGLVILSLSLLLHHGPATALTGYVHGHGDGWHAMDAPCNEHGDAHHGAADPCKSPTPHQGAACWGGCCPASAFGVVPARDAKAEIVLWRTEAGTLGSRSYRLDPPPPRATA
jgi:hypothetical protein